jgi:hypothetical protein
MSLNGLPAYVSHKRVKAAPIVAVRGSEPMLSPVVEIKVPGGPNQIVAVPRGIFSRGTPIEGDYLVVYEDGHMSWSPRKAFKEGYRPDEPSSPVGSVKLFHDAFCALLNSFPESPERKLAIDHADEAMRLGAIAVRKT